MENTKQLIDFIPQSSLEALQKEIGSLHSEPTVFYWSNAWSMHELILYLLSQSGPSEVCISSFSVSEEAVRAFATAKDLGYIKKLTVLFDYTTKKHKADFVNFIHNVSDNIRTCANHSKGVLIEGDLEIAVLSSQNLNRNHRLECGAITADHWTFGNLKSKFLEFYAKATPLWTSQTTN